MTWKLNVGWQVAVLMVPISLAVAPLSRAQGALQSGGALETSQAPSGRSERIGEIERSKAVFVNEMLAKFADGAAAKGYDAYWQKGQRNLLTRSAEELLAISERATDFDSFDKLVFRGFKPNFLGDLTQDLVYFPLPPCRLLDSRFATLAQYQGPKAPATEIPFSVNDALGVQGGNAAGCGVPVIDPPALSVVVAAVPTDTGQGNLRLYPTTGTIPTASLVNYQNAVVVASGTITQSCTSCGDELTVRNGGGGTTHIVVDVTGYFAPPTPTALDCVEVYAPNTVVPAGGLTCNSTALACPAAYARVAAVTKWVSGGPAALTQVQADQPLSSYSNACWDNRNATAATMTAGIRCCRVP